MSNQTPHHTTALLPAKAHAGFTLLEMLVVMGLLGIMAWGLVALLDDDGHWRRDEITQERWNSIRTGVIGQPHVIVNGSPHVAGYVADMGRLPTTIAELLTQFPLFDFDNDGMDDSACLFNGTAIQQPNYTDIPIEQYDAAPGFINTISGGWRGPYIHTAGSRRYGDGWFGAQDHNPSFSPKDSQDGCNFGWLVTPIPPLPASLNAITDLQVYSLGSNRVLGGSGSAQEFPATNIHLIHMSEWTLATAPMTFNLQFSRALQTADIPLLDTPAPNTPHTLQLVIYRYVDNGDDEATFAGDVEESDSGTFILSEGSAIAPSQTIYLAGLPIGRYAAVIWCTNNTVSRADDSVYDGDCDGGSINHSPVYFTLMPHTSQVTIVWNLP